MIPSVHLLLNSLLMLRSLDEILIFPFPLLESGVYSVCLFNSRDSFLDRIIVMSFVSSQNKGFIINLSLESCNPFQYINMGQKQRPAAVPVNTKVIQNSFGIFTLLYSFLEFLPETAYWFSATKTPGWYQHNITSILFFLSFTLLLAPSRASTASGRLVRLCSSGIRYQQ
jgi:hypothetical protein